MHRVFSLLRKAIKQKFKCVGPFLIAKITIEQPFPLFFFDSSISKSLIVIVLLKIVKYFEEKKTIEKPFNIARIFTIKIWRQLTGIPGGALRTSVINKGKI